MADLGREDGPFHKLIGCFADIAREWLLLCLVLGASNVSHKAKDSIE